VYDLEKMEEIIQKDDEPNTLIDVEDGEDYWKLNLFQADDSMDY
jgi:hypothetical protein